MFAWKLGRNNQMGMSDFEFNKLICSQIHEFSVKLLYFCLLYPYLSMLAHSFGQSYGRNS